MREGNRFGSDKTGAEIVEWIVVTMILIIAFFALLQAIGDDLRGFFTTASQWLTDLLAR